MMQRILLLVILAMLIACDQTPISTVNDATKGVGTLVFVVNGEDFIRKGFTSKDGWQLEFDEVFINLSDIKACQLSKSIEELAYIIPKDAVEVKLSGEHGIDLAAGGEDATPIVVGKVENAPSGMYNGIVFAITRAGSGKCAGCSLVIRGKATKGEQKLEFSIGIEREIEFTGGGYVGEGELKGILEDGKSAEVEMTFHFDHLFGDASEGEHGHNENACGFSPFAALAKEGKVNLCQSELEIRLSESDYQKFCKNITTLGHVGEGHCKAREKGDR